MFNVVKKPVKYLDGPQAGEVVDTPFLEIRPRPNGPLTYAGSDIPVHYHSMHVGDVAPWWTGVIKGSYGRGSYRYDHRIVLRGDDPDHNTVERGTRLSPVEFVMRDALSHVKLMEVNVLCEICGRTHAVTIGTDRAPGNTSVIVRWWIEVPGLGLVSVYAAPAWASANVLWSAEFQANDTSGPDHAKECQAVVDQGYVNGTMESLFGDGLGWMPILDVIYLGGGKVRTMADTGKIIRRRDSWL